MHCKLNVKYCFYIFIQEELDEVARVWNAHRIRPSANERVPSGRPLIMYTLPQVYNTRDYSQPVEADAVDVCASECTFRSVSCDEDMHELFQIYMASHGWTMPVDHSAAVDLYIRLREAICSEL